MYSPKAPKPRKSLTPEFDPHEQRRWHDLRSYVRAMSLCIAAQTHERGHPRIVVAFDSLIGDDLGVSEAEFKCDLEFAPGLAMLYAGTLEDARDAVRLYKERFRVTPATLNHVKEQLYVGMKEFKEFLKLQGRKDRSDVELILAGFIESEPKILYCSASTVVSRTEFLAIGSGSASAEAMLRWRQSTRDRPLSEVLYYVYDANKFGETSPYVGGMTTMLALEPSPDGRLGVRTVVSSGIQFLHTQFLRFCPQPYENPDLFPLSGLL